MGGICRRVDDGRKLYFWWRIYIFDDTTKLIFISVQVVCKGERLERRGSGETFFMTKPASLPNERARTTHRAALRIQALSKTARAGSGGSERASVRAFGLGRETRSGDSHEEEPPADGTFVTLGLLILVP